MNANVSRYIGLITSEHADKPNFVATVAASVQPFADALATLNALPQAFDVDFAIGAQLDIVGEWIGATRYVRTLLGGTYFSFDIDGVGWDQGAWYTQGEATTGLTALPDDIFRLLLKAKIAANQWDGTIPGAYAAWDQLFAADGMTILIQDHGDMTMTMAVVGATSTAFLDLFTGGYLDLRPAGVLIDSYLYPSASAPLFGFDAENPSISGFNVGAWGVTAPVDEPFLILSGGTLFFDNQSLRAF